MITARWIDNIWATRKAEALKGYKLMLAETITAPGERSQKMVVVDIISAGIGDRVIITTGSSARKMLESDNVPVDAVVVGIIDEDCLFEFTPDEGGR